MQFINYRLYWLLPALFLFSCTALSVKNTATSENALQRLQAGNSRFVHHHMKHPDQSAKRVAETAGGQKPFAVVVTCADSRVSPEIVFDEGIGDLFTIRNAGNVVEQTDVLASVEYAVEHLGVHTVVVIGHERCGAIQAMIGNATEHEPEHIAALVRLLRAEQEEQSALKSDKKGDELTHLCVAANVEHGVHALQQQIEHLHLHEHVDVVGAIYDLQTGEVHFMQ